MNRNDVLKPFENERGLMESRIQSGIEGRKSSALLHVVDETGKPVSWIHAEIRQKSHEFKYGANLFMLEEFPEQEQNEAYKKIFAESFNIATLPFYWRDLEPEPGKLRFAKDSPKVYRRPAPDLCLEYCESNGIMPKAHCLNYAGFSPEWVPADVAEEKRLLEKRFVELSERYSNRIRDWEVTNETFWDVHSHKSLFYDEPDFVEWSFHKADQYFPKNRLIINEAHSRIWSNLFFHMTRSPYYMQIERAIERGARIDSIGMQYHMFYRREEEAPCTAEFYSPRRIYEVLDTFALLGKPIQITELTCPAYSNLPEDEEIQAEILRNLYSMWFSHPAVEAILYWNLVDGFAYGTTPGDMQNGENYFYGGLVRYDFTPKPALKVIQELFGKTWRTNLSLDSDADGTLSFRGFPGEYEVVLSGNGKTATHSFSLSGHVPTPSVDTPNELKLSIF